MNNKQRGTATERIAEARLVNMGFQVVRSAGSHSAADLVAVNENAVLFVQCKRTKDPLSEARLARFKRLAEAEFQGWALPDQAAAQLWVYGERLPGKREAQGWRFLTLEIQPIIDAHADSR